MGGKKYTYQGCTVVVMYSEVVGTYTAYLAVPSSRHVDFLLIESSGSSSLNLEVDVSMRGIHRFVLVLV